MTAQHQGWQNPARSWADASSAKDAALAVIAAGAGPDGRSTATIEDVKRQTGALGGHATTHLIYSLQKGGWITFKERRVGTSSHDLYDFRLTARGIARWFGPVPAHTGNLR